MEAKISQCEETACWRKTLSINGGAIRKNIDDTKHIVLFWIKRFKILYEKKDIRKNDKRLQEPRYWKFSGRISLKNLKTKAARGIASVW